MKVVPSQEKHSQHSSPLAQFSNLFCRHLARLMSHAGAMDEYNTIEGLLAPVRAGRIAATEWPIPDGAGRRTRVSHVVAPCAWH